MSASNGYSVMVVDDEVDIRESMTELLQSQGYETLSAVNGRDALAQLRLAEHPPTAIVLDMMMPTMDGLSFRWEQLADPKLADIPVIILSASGYAHASAVELCTAGCIQKPCKPAELLRMLARVCST
ncbi:MAG: chemotaxis protein CheY [Myxococcaceae bacterium]|nr:chemotaxis protein CheY [Myxococcaceae bacterium]